MEINDMQFCKKRGFQKEKGFEIDEVVGEISIPVVLCHSRQHKKPKERVLMPSPDGAIRVHDYIMIARSHGKQIPGDRWSFAKSFGKRLMTILGRVLTLYKASSMKKMKKLLDQLIQKL